MKSRTSHSHSHSHSHSQRRTRSLRAPVPSPALAEYLARKYQNAVPSPALTAAHKLYTSSCKPLHKEHRFLKRFEEGSGTVNGERLMAYLGRSEGVERGRPLGGEAVERVYLNYANHDGKLSFDYLMKMAECSGSPISERAAKAMVRRYGKGKDHLTLQDCLSINERFATRHAPKPRSSNRK